MNKLNSKSLIRIFQVIVTALATLYLLTIVNWSEFLTTVRNIDLIWFIPISLVYFIGIMISALRWQTILKSLKYEISLPDLFKTYLVGAFYNNFLPSSFGGDLVKFARLNSRVNKKSLAASLLMDRVWGTITICLISFFFFIILLIQGSSITYDISVVLMEILFAIGLLFTTFTLFFGNRISDKLRLYGENLRYQYYKKFVLNLSHILRLLPKTRSTFLNSLLFSALVICGHYFVFKSLGRDLDLVQISTIPAIISIISILPISLGSLGIKENAFVHYYSLIGVPSEVALSAALINRISILIYSLIGIFFI